MKKKTAPKKKGTLGGGLIIRKDSFSHTISEHGEPIARVTIPYANIEGLLYETDWNNHSLVKIHGCTPEGAEAAVKSAYVGQRKALADPAHEETQLLCVEYAIRRFWGEEGRSISKRFRDLAEDIEELEGSPGWNPLLKQFVYKLAQASRKKSLGKSRARLADRWLLDNWVEGEKACLLNNRQISEKIGKVTTEYDVKKIASKIKGLRLVKAKKPTRETGYRAHKR
jgi:hypothetical protein